MKTATPFSNSFTLTINPGLNFSNSQTTFPQGKNPPAFIPQTPFCGREISRGKAKNPFPQKNRFSFCRVHIEAPRTARILGGQNPKEKCPFHFQEKIHPRQIRNARSVFSFGVAGVLASAWGFLRAYDFGQSHHALRACDIICFESRF